MKHTLTNIAAMLLLLSAGRLVAQQADEMGFDRSAQNIFDLSRHRPIIMPAAIQHTVDYFTLSGTMSYEDKKYAFFEGAGSEMQNHAFAPSESINGCKIVEIANNYVKLMATGGQPINLGLGMQMRRTDNGPWTPSAASAGTTIEEHPEAGGADSDVARRLMQRREQQQ